MARKNRGEYPSSKEILQLLAGGAILAGSFLMPGLAKALPSLEKPWSDFDLYRLRQSLRRLKRRKMIATKEEGGETVIVLSNKGREEILRYKLDEIEIKKPRRWDRRWRMVIFDIPEKKKKAREAFRQRLKQLDFYPLQRSVYVHPYPCEKEIEFLRQNFEVENEASFVLVSEFESEEEQFLRKYFGV